MLGKVEICGVNTAKLPVLKGEETCKLLEKARDGSGDARERLISGNLRLVLSVVQKFSNRGESMDDLFQVGCIGLAQALGKMPSASERILYTVDFIEEVTKLSDVGRYMTMLLELDAFFLNEDRHTNNLAVIRNETTLAFRLCPIFDNGLALLADTNDYPVNCDIYECIEKVKAKPFDLSFDEQVCAAENLYGSPLKFSFTKRDVSEILKELSDVYPNDVISRVEGIIYEQMRKYPIFF